ncbi:lytic transglycosylase domain-containing protein [Ramlibacter sp. MAHUQ-53]|uniref:lytic transglycosylase domain-containing protein n=1 Tax=unclassified Ramlibacter TaxID=2617605 RepID=UPI0036314759
MRPARAWLLALLLAASAGARADVWGFVDARGVAFFAGEKLDERYELFSRGDGPLAPAPLASAAEGAAPAAPRPADDGVASPKLLAWLAAAPGVRQAQPLLHEAARAHNLDVELLQALVATESGFDAQAVSPKGAIGLMQVIPATAERFGVAGSPRHPVARQLLDPRTNVRAGARYLRHLVNLFPGRLELALAAYNAGEGAVLRAGNRIPDIRETRHYVRTVMQLYAALKPAPEAQASAASTASTATAITAGTGAHRVRMELPAPVPGRARMPPSLGAPLAAVPSLVRTHID